MRILCLVLALSLALAAADRASDDRDRICYPPQSEIDALEAMFHALGGPEWRHTDNWGVGNPCGYGKDDHDNWIGILCGECDDNVRHVEIIALEWNNLVGDLPEAMGDLPHLQVVNMGTNSVGGTLPESLGKATKMRVVKLSYNKVEGKYPASWLNMHELEILDLPYNDVVANVNDLLAAYPRLRKLDARGNRGFSGDLGAADESFAKMENLRIMDLHWNNIGGTLPPALFRIHSLEELILSNNQVSGQLPEVDLPNVQNIQLQNNYVQGTLPPSLGHAASLQKLNLMNNQVSASIPETFANLQSISELNLKNNVLDSPIPDSFWAGVGGTVKQLDISQNEFGGTLPAEAFSALQHAETVNLAGCALSGELPSTVGELKSATRLDLRANFLSGSIPDEIGELGELSELLLRNNRFSGAVPASIGKLRKLVDLMLQMNRLTSLPETIGDLESLRNLYVHSNKLAGTIPGVIGYLHELERLSLHNNEFTGRIPEDFGNLFNLLAFSAHNNKLEGNPWPRMDPGVDSENPDGVPQPFCEDLRNYTTGEKTHSYFRVCGTRNDFYVDILNTDPAHEWRETHGEDWSTCYGKCMSSANYDRHRDFQVTSRYADMYEVADKAKFAAYMLQSQQRAGPEFEFHPPTFRLPFELDAYKEEHERHPDGLWLLKPSISCCGQNIRLVKGPDDPTFPKDLGNWILQRFVHPPFLFRDHKVVLRLFTMVTSFSPLRMYWFPDGPVFYTHAEYDPTEVKRGYFITDYFFTKKQHTMFTTSNQLFGELKKLGYDTDQIFRDIADVMVKALMVAEPTMRSQEKERMPHPEALYEVVGYDILLDANLKPWVCEVNTTPNMGLEINRGNDALVHEEDFDNKIDIMRGCLELPGIVRPPPDSPNYANTAQEACSAIVYDKLAELGVTPDTTLAKCPSLTDFTCITEAEVALLVESECEYQRRGKFELIFPEYTHNDADKYLDLFKVKRRENYLMAWWHKMRPEPEREYPTPWGGPPPKSRWREVDANYTDADWYKHQWTQNTPSPKWNTEEDGAWPDPNEEDTFILDDGDAFDDDEEPGIPPGMDPEIQISDEEFQKWLATQEGEGELGGTDSDGAYADAAPYEQQYDNLDDFDPDVAMEEWMKAEGYDEADFDFDWSATAGEGGAPDPIGTADMHDWGDGFEGGDWATPDDMMDMDTMPGMEDADFNSDMVDEFPEGFVDDVDDDKVAAPEPAEDVEIEVGSLDEDLPDWMFDLDADEPVEEEPVEEVKPKKKKKKTKKRKKKDKKKKKKKKKGKKKKKKQASEDEGPPAGIGGRQWMMWTEDEFDEDAWQKDAQAYMEDHAAKKGTDAYAPDPVADADVEVLPLEMD